MRKYIPAIVLIAVIVAGAAVILTRPSSSNNPSTNSTNTGTDKTSIPDVNKTKDVSIENMMFTPAQVTVANGVTVIWTNNDSVAHTVTADDGSFDSGAINPGSTYHHTFTSAGSVPYHCSFHSEMHGTVVVQ